MNRMSSLFLLLIYLLTSFSPRTDAFEAIWSAPSNSCVLLNATQPIAKWGIRVNPDQTLHGPELVLFYERDLGERIVSHQFNVAISIFSFTGLYPHYNKTIKKWIHGGIPQRTDFAAHLAKA